MTIQTTVQHHRHFDQHADNGGERGAGVKAEQADRGGDRQLEEVAGADQRRGTGNAMLLAGSAIKQIGEPGVEIDLDQDRNSEQRDDQRLRDDLFALEAEQQHQRRQQRDERDRAERGQQPRRAPARPPDASSRRRRSCATMTGTTM